MSNTLHSLVKDLNAIEELILENEGEVCETLESWMTINQDNIATKVDGYNYLIQRLEKGMEYFKNIEIQYQNARKAYERQIDKMKSNVKFTMLNMQLDELKGNEYRFKLSKSKPKVIVENIDELDFIYVREKIVQEVDKDAIKKAFDDGMEVKGAALETSYSLRSYLNTKLLETK